MGIFLWVAVFVLVTVALVLLCKVLLLGMKDTNEKDSGREVAKEVTESIYLGKEGIAEARKFDAAKKQSAAKRVGAGRSAAAPSYTNRKRNSSSSSDVGFTSTPIYAYDDNDSGRCSPSSGGYGGGFSGGSDSGGSGGSDGGGCD